MKWIRYTGPVSEGYIRYDAEDRSKVIDAVLEPLNEATEKRVREHILKLDPKAEFV